MDELATGFASLSLQDQVLLDFGGDARKGVTVAAAASSSSSSLSSTSSSSSSSSSSSCCAICLEKIELQEMALVKGGLHTRRIQFAPKCKFPFEFLILHRALDGGYVAVLDFLSRLSYWRANWFEPLPIVAQEEVTDEYEEYYLFEEEDDDGMDDFYLSGSSNLRIGNRRWRSNGYVRTRRREAKLISNEGFQQDLDHVGSSRHANKGKKIETGNGRRAKRAMKREAADRAICHHRAQSRL
ncbi:hypothetical protein Syun_017771 [Stephania yunnanensis]|uniref:Uncharacterized protein n=1 Tax=Stephania yunnanensis TaxID=152371 RepID=A0AAP0J7Q6_9MAGN